MSRVQIQEVVDGTSVLLNDTVRFYCESFEQCLETLPEDVPERSRNKLKDYHSLLTNWSNPFLRYDTEYKRIKHLRKEGMVYPVTKTFGLRQDVQQKQRKHFHAMKRCTYQYVPLLETIRSLLSKKEIFDVAIKPMIHCTDGLMTDFSCGSLFKNSTFYQQHPESLQLLLYADDVEVNNPLGSKAGINKMTMVYFIVKNIPNHSGLNHIHLAIVSHSSDVKRFGMDKLFQPLIEDLKLLEEGVTLDLGHGVHKIYGTITQFAADNLAANEVSGMVCSFSANYYCRFCVMPSTQCQQSCYQDKDLLRSQQTHLGHLEASRSAVHSLGMFICELSLLN